MVPKYGAGGVYKRKSKPVCSQQEKEAQGICLSSQKEKTTESIVENCTKEKIESVMHRN
jgi:hypothetical protein